MLGSVTLNTNHSIVVGRPGAVDIYPHIPTSGYLALPEQPTTETGFLAGSPRFAAGDFSGDGITDLVAVNATTMQRHIGNGTGGFIAQPVVTATPGPGGGRPAVVGRTTAVANTRLRLYDSRCTAAPSGFPTNETFGAGALCASVDLAGTSTAVRAVAMPDGSRSFTLVQLGTTWYLYEILVASAGSTTTVRPVQRSSFSLAGVEGVAWSPADRILVFSHANGIISARRLLTTPTTATFDIPAGLAAFVPHPRATTEPLKAITVAELTDGQRWVIVTEEKPEFFSAIPFNAAGWVKPDIVNGSYDAIPQEDERASAVIAGHFDDDDRLDLAFWMRPRVA